MKIMKLNPFFKLIFAAVFILFIISIFAHLSLQEIEKLSHKINTQILIKNNQLSQKALHLWLRGKSKQLEKLSETDAIHNLTRNLISTKNNELFIKSNREDLVTVSKFNQFQETLIFYIATSNYQYIQIGSQGRMIVATAITNKKIKKFFSAVFAREGTVILPFRHHAKWYTDQQNQTDYPTILISSPIISRQSNQLGRISFRLDLKKALVALTQNTNASSSIYTYIVDSEKNIMSLAEGSNSAIRSKIPVNLQDTNAQNNIHFFNNYKNEKVLGVFSWDQKHNLGFVSYMNYSRSVILLTKSKRIIIFLITAIFLATFLFAFVIFKFNKRYQQVKSRSEIDKLTQIPNRRKFDEVLKRVFLNSRSTRSTFSLIMIDVDFFKKYNDSLGHQAGDNVLREVAYCLSTSVTRKNDFVARYGGEEFSIILPFSNREQTIAVVERFQKKIESKQIQHPESEVSSCITVSSGAAIYSYQDINKPEQLLKMADKALYNAKENGRNRLEFYNF
jgi:diguanylate cyclase (GGDEF)-like protein